jgi:hypothetical protein
MSLQEQKDDDLEFQEQLNTLLTDGQTLLNSLQTIRQKNEFNLHCKFFEYLDRASIVEFICPFLELKDMVSLRSTCRLMNQTISSMRNLLSHTYYLKKKFKSSQPKGGEKQIDITALSSNLGEEDMQIQVESLKNINEFLKNKLFESEKIIKVYKNDIDFLKGQSKVQEEMTSTLKETLEQSREEQENIKKENILLKQKYEDLKKKYDENNKSHLNVIENLRKDNEGLKKDKTKLAAAIVQMRKITEDLRKKNTSKAEALLAIKNFFMNSTLVKLKDIEGFKEAEDNLENKNNNISDTNTNKNTDEGK